MQIDLGNLTLEQKEMIFKIGVLKIIESIYEGVPSIERLQKNIHSFKDKSGFSYEEIWQIYEFLCLATLNLGKSKNKPVIGFVQPEN